MVTPLAVSALYRTKLLRASVAHNTDGYLRVRRQCAAFSDLVAAGELAIFAVDFSSWSARSRAPPDTLCGHEERLGAEILAGLPPITRTMP